MNKPLTHHTHKELVELCKEYKVKYHDSSKPEMISRLRPLLTPAKVDLQGKVQEDLTSAHRSCAEFYEDLITRQKKSAPDVLRIMNTLAEFNALLCRSKY